MTYERDLDKQIKKIINHIEHRQAFIEQPEIVSVIHKTSKGMLDKIEGCNGDRIKRLGLEKDIRSTRMLTYKYCI